MINFKNGFIVIDSENLCIAWTLSKFHKILLIFGVDNSRFGKFFESNCEYDRISETLYSRYYFGPWFFMIHDTLKDDYSNFDLI